MAVLGVRKPRPTSLYHLRPPLPTARDFPDWSLELRKMCGCFYDAPVRLCLLSTFTLASSQYDPMSCMYLVSALALDSKFGGHDCGVGGREMWLSWRSLCPLMIVWSIFSQETFHWPTLALKGLRLAIFFQWVADYNPGVSTELSFAKVELHMSRGTWYSRCRISIVHDLQSVNNIVFVYIFLKLYFHCLDFYVG